MSIIIFITIITNLNIIIFNFATFIIFTVRSFVRLYRSCNMILFIKFFRLFNCYLFIFT
ncbi:hypothetical protein C1646_702342 [Rhizophagus diaphanus]|nr:hypothetical protein C1646_702342 [Rhizophagus diaphanus] [Rhizophagus sp. MUCL 43196]